MARKSKLAARLRSESPKPLSGRPYRDVFHLSHDGLRLHARDYGDAISPFLPVVCLPGLTRTARDFDDLATLLSTHPQRPRRVLAFDLRGRGQSAWDPNAENYNPLTEMADVLDGMAAHGIGKAVLVGTSRGGIISMLIGVARPAVLAGVVLVDVGPVLDPAGLARIKSYVGRMPIPDDWTDAVELLKRLHGQQFPGLDEEGWRAYARTTWQEENGRPVSDYDPALSHSLAAFDFDAPVPTLWDQFGSLARLPVLAIRGQRSDLLSAETLKGMSASHPGLETIVVEGQGHAPLLRGATLLEAISAFIDRAEGDGPPAESVSPRDLPSFSLDKPRAAES